MKQFFKTAAICIITASVITACGETYSRSSEKHSERSDRSVEDSNKDSKNSDKTIIEQAAEQLEGTWFCQDSDTVYSYYTFDNGNYCVDTYVNGKKLENSTYGVYTIDAYAIHTVTTSQKTTLREV